MRRADNLTIFLCRLSRNSGATTSWNLKGLSRPVVGKLYLYPFCGVPEHVNCIFAGARFSCDKFVLRRNTIKLSQCRYVVKRRRILMVGTGYWNMCWLTSLLLCRCHVNVTISRRHQRNQQKITRYETYRQNIDASVFSVSMFLFLRNRVLRSQGCTPFSNHTHDLIWLAAGRTSCHAFH